MKNKMNLIIMVVVLNIGIINFPCAYSQDASIRNPSSPEMSGQPYTGDRSVEPGQFSGERGPDSRQRRPYRDERLLDDRAQDMLPEPEIKPAPEEAIKDISSEEIEKGLKVDNEEISLDLKGIDLNEFFRIISLRMGVTIVVSKGVTGRVNIFLNNLTFKDALDVILVSQELAYDKKGKVINIMTAAEYERLYGKKYDEKRKLKDIQLKYAKPSSVFATLGQIKSDIGKIIVDEATGTLFLLDIPEKLELMEEAVKIVDRPLPTEVFDLKYAKTSDMKAQLGSVITGGSGEMFTDDRTNTVAISDLPDKIKKIKALIKAFDVETPQVFIEAEIVQVVLNNEYQRGVDWEKIFSQNSLKDLDLIGKFPVSPVLSTFQKVSIGSLSRDNYTLALNFVNTYGDTKILSRPRITVLNNQEAKIMVGSREAYVSQTLSQGQSTTVSTENIQFIDVGIKLKVTPAINKDGFVTMAIKPEVSSVRETITTALGSRVPIVETSEAETSVKVKDGTMIMIAGLMKEEKRDDIAGFPFLAKVPFIGAFFGNRSKQKKNTELIIFLTPHIITADSDFARIEKYIPADIIPEDMQKDIISRKINSTFGEEKKNAQIKGKNTAVLQEQAKDGKSQGIIEEKIKGMK